MSKESLFYSGTAFGMGEKTLSRSQGAILFLALLLVLVEF